MRYHDSTFVIPAFNPDNILVELIKEIRSKSDSKIFVLNDGSRTTCDSIFDEIASLEDDRVFLSSHAINLGKGAALKNVFNTILTEHTEIEYAVTLDSDGQHCINDCLKVLDSLKTKDGRFVLGARTFNSSIPWKSYIGNNISRLVYRFVLGHNFKDTQTGLRGLNKSFMKQCLEIKSNRFEFETEQLALSVRSEDIVEIPIQTIYINENSASSFRPLVDSFKIYFILLRYALSSILTTLADFMVFIASIGLGFDIFLSNMFSRTAAIGVQFTLLNKIVFRTKPTKMAFFSFVLYVYIMGGISSWAQIGLVELLNISEVSSKILVETTLFFVNFSFLKLFIFNSKKRLREKSIRNSR